MRTNVPARYARWSALAAVAVALFVAGLYLRHSWQVRRARQEIPAEVPPSVQQQSAEFSFSKMDGDRTEFTVRASKATEYAQGGRDLLEDVSVTVYGRLGQRFDNFRTRSCEYLATSGDIQCAGDVQIDLQAAEDARLHPVTPSGPNAAAHIVHVDTSGVAFNQKTGQASTDRPVAFRLPQGDGQAVGFRYDSEAGRVQLLRDVKLVLYQAVPENAANPHTDSASDITILGSSLTYLRDERRLTLLGPVSARQETRELASEKLELELNAELRPRRLLATGHPILSEAGSGSSRTIAAAEISATFATTGSLEDSIAEGSVHATARSAGREDQLDADRAQLAFIEGSDRPQRLTATGNVRVQSILSGADRRLLQTSQIVLDFAKAGRSGEASIEHATTPAATIDFLGATTLSGKSAPEQIHLTSQHLEADFGPSDELREITGGGGVEVRRQIANEPVQTSASRELTARFATGGEWSTIDQNGEVRLGQADQSALADRVHFDHDSDAVALTGSVRLSDARTRTTAASGLLRQREHEFQAQGGVVTNDTSVGVSPATPGQGPARISAERMTADTATGRAVYSGGARLWQGDSLVESDVIDLDRAAQTVIATGKVRAILPQARWSPSGGAVPPRTLPAKNEYVHAEAERMTYSSRDALGHLEGEAQVESDEGRMRADIMDLFFAPAKSAGGDSTALPPAKTVGGNLGKGQQLTRATADGHVIVEQADRQGRGEHADYTPTTGKIELSGGPPIVRDASGNETTGRQLTFYFRDDTITIDSAEGMRTLTLHRVEK